MPYSILERLFLLQVGVSKMVKKLEDMKDKKLVRLIHLLEKSLEGADYQLSDFVLQEVAMSHLTARGYSVRYYQGHLICQKVNEMLGGGEIVEAK